MSVLRDPVVMNLDAAKDQKNYCRIDGEDFEIRPLSLRTIANLQPLELEAENCQKIIADESLPREERQAAEIRVVENIINQFVTILVVPADKREQVINGLSEKALLILQKQLMMLKFGAYQREGLAENFFPQEKQPLETINVAGGIETLLQKK